VLFLTIVAILFLCVIDAIITLYLLNHGAYETNPLMALLLNQGPWAFFIFKYGLTIIATFCLLMFRCVVVQKLNVSTHTILYLLAWVYAAVVGWELYLVYHVIWSFTFISSCNNREDGYRLSTKSFRQGWLIN
jgi:hypothetical protein